jgi:hypothetical protein
MIRAFGCALLLVICASTARADYFVLRSGARLNVNSWELIGERYRIQLNGGTAELPYTDVVSIEPEEIFVPAPRMPLDQAPFGQLIRDVSEKYGVDSDLVFSVIAAESNFNPRAVSRRGARGLMQLLPSTATRLGVRNAFDPRENVDAGTRFLRDLLKQYQNDLQLTLAAYNAGPAAVQKYGRVPPYNETMAYIRAIRKTYALRKAKPDGSGGKSSP